MKRPPTKTTRRKPPPPTAPRERLRMPAALPAPVARRLRALAARALHVAWTRGMLWVLVAFGALAASQCVADLLFDLPLRTRASFLLADMAVLVFLVTRHGVIPWRRRLSPDEAALLAQKHWPEFKTTLISAVQLARHPNGSPWMITTLQQQVATHVARRDLRQAVAWRQLRGLFLGALGLLIGIGLLAWQTAPTSTILARRALLANLPLPTRTIVVAVSQNLAIAPGETVTLAARAQGEIPRSGRLEISYAGKAAESVAVSAKPASPDLFSLTLPNVQQPLTYRFYLNDGRGAEWQVSLLHAPVIQAIHFRVIYPAYTGLGEAPAAAGNLRLLAGSRLQISGRASQPLQSAHVVPQPGGAPTELRLGGDRMDFKGELSVPTKGLTGFTIALRNDQGIASRDDTLYAVEIVPDQPPEITLAPDQAEKATFIATARPELRFQVRDDFLVQKVLLCVEPSDAVGEGESPNPAKAKRVPIDIPKPASALTFDFHWTDPEKTVKWSEGNTFYYWIEAVDNNNVTGPGVTHTDVREWSVVSLKTKRDELTETLRKSADSIETLSRSQEELRSNVSNLLKQNDAKTP